MSTDSKSKCPYCGSPVQENASFCLHCMKPLAEKKLIKKKKSFNPYIVWPLCATVLFAVVFFATFAVCKITDKPAKVIAKGSSVTVSEDKNDKKSTLESDGGTQSVTEAEKSTENAESGTADTAKADGKTAKADGKNLSDSTDKTDTQSSAATASGSTKSAKNTLKTSSSGSSGNKSGSGTSSSSKGGTSAGNTAGGSASGGTTSGGSTSGGSTSGGSTSGGSTSGGSTPDGSTSGGSTSGGSTGGSETTSPPTASHTHSYTRSSTIRKATCASDGEKQYICSCGATYTEKIPATGEHTWYDLTKTVHYDEVGHYQDVSASRRVQKYKCPVCSYNVFSTADEYYSHFDSAHKPSYQGDPVSMLRNRYTLVDDYESYTKKEWVVDRKAYDDVVVVGHKCSVCGLEK